MFDRRQISLVLSFLTLPVAGVSANVLELSSALESGRFIDGVNLTQNLPSVALGAEWSSESGMFASLNCFLSEQDDTIALQRGCDAQAGLFTVLANQQALTVTLSRHDYSSPELTDWEYTDLSVRWHLSKTLSMGVRASDSLLGQDIASATLFAHASHALSDKLGMNIEAGYTELDSNRLTDSLSYALAGIEYAHQRWTLGAQLMWSDDNYDRFSRLENDTLALGVSLSYRLY